MLEKIINAIAEKQIIAIMGCSPTAEKYYGYIKKIDSSVGIMFMDNSVDKQRKGYCNEKVISPIDCSEYNIGLIIIASLRFYAEMKKQIDELGIDDSNVVFVDEIVAIEKEKNDAIIRKRTAKKEINFVVDLAEHCNLNCQNCDHFSPLAKEHFTDLGEFENDIKRMAELFGGHGELITHVDLEGGEPLLNQEVVKYIDIVHKYMPNTIVKIFTNGTLLLKQSDEFWDTCNRYSVVLEITKYPIEFDYESVERVAIEKGVNLEYYSGGCVVKTSSHKPLDLTGKQDKYDSFNKCYLANGDCPMLKGGKLYPCTIVPNISTFNDYFNKNLDVCERDSIDIYKVDSAEEILDFLANPIPACRYCQPDKWTHGHEWKTSTYEMREWAE